MDVNIWQLLCLSITIYMWEQQVLITGLSFQENRMFQILKWQFEAKGISVLASLCSTDNHHVVLYPLDKDISHKNDDYLHPLNYVNITLMVTNTATI